MLLPSSQWSHEDPQTIAPRAPWSTDETSRQRVAGSISEGRASGCGVGFGRACAGNSADIQRPRPTRGQHRLLVAEFDGAVSSRDEVEPALERWGCAQGDLTTSTHGIGKKAARVASIGRIRWAAEAFLDCDGRHQRAPPPHANEAPPGPCLGRRACLALLTGTACRPP